MNEPHEFQVPQSEARLRWGDLSGVCLAYLVFVGFSFLRVPIPGVNEPHYLCKAKHFWNPEWCAGDLFLESSNPHLVFYWTFGWLTQFLDLRSVAVVSRLVGIVPLAIGWQRLVAALTGMRAVGTLVPLVLFLVLHAAGNWSGEWLVGGIESKVVAYGCLFWAASELLNLRFRMSATLAGLAVSFHPVVGAWGVVCACGAGSYWLLRTPGSLWRNRIPGPAVWLGAVVLFLFTAMPGLWCAGRAVFTGDPESNRIATLLQVGFRLSHHLDPMAFPKEAYRYICLLIVGWLLLARDSWTVPRKRWWNLFVICSILVALAGVFVGWGPRPLKQLPGYEWRMTVLKFYPFRLADLLVPMALSIAAGEQMGQWARRSNSYRQRFGIGVLTASLAWLSIVIPGTDQNPSRMTPSQLDHWEQACLWIRDNTPEQAVLYSFDTKWAIKWYAERPEYVNYKDCPQDAESIVEWNRRRWVIARWRQSAFEDGVASEEELQALAQKTGASIFIANRTGPIESEPVFQNVDVRVYRVNE